MYPLPALKQRIDVMADALANAGPSFRYALLAISVFVLRSDGPITSFESLFLDALFAPDLNAENVELKLTMSNEHAGEMLRTISDFAPSLGEAELLRLVSDTFDLAMAADKLPSETEAWAAAKVLTKIRQMSGVPEPKDNESPILELNLSNSRGLDQSAGIGPWRKVTAGASDLERHLTELHNLIGLDEVKLQVQTLVNLAKVRKMREARGLPSPQMSFHLVFSGNPGTGKTTVARIIGQIYGCLGLLSKGKCIEADRGTFVGQYLGQSTTKTTQALNDALGSVLFVDEAYSLTEGNNNEYGQEALTVILKFMEDHRDDFILIVAGYTGQMGRFLDSNPGLRSRFSRAIEFPDYSTTDLIQIFQRMCAASSYRLSQNAVPLLETAIAEIVKHKKPDFANAREVRRLFEHSVERQANRIVGKACSDDELCMLEALDFEDVVAQERP